MAFYQFGVLAFSDYRETSDEKIGEQRKSMCVAVRVLDSDIDTHVSVHVACICVLYVSLHLYRQRL